MARQAVLARNNHLGVSNSDESAESALGQEIRLNDETETNISYADFLWIAPYKVGSQDIARCLLN